MVLPTSFKEFNKLIGNPIHPDKEIATPIYNYQIEYFENWVKHHKLMLNKSRKIGATETALRIIAYLTLTGVYANHRVMIVAGNKQHLANRFIERLKNIFPKGGFYDKAGTEWTPNDLIIEENNSVIKFWNGTHIQAYPATEAVRGEENVKCVFLTECAFINRLDDSRVYNALHPNVANIPDADFIMESTPNGKRGFFWENWDASSEYRKIQQPYQVSLNKLLTEDFIETERKNPRINFEQEYCCDFTTSTSSAFNEASINFVEKPINNYENLG